MPIAPATVVPRRPPLPSDVLGLAPPTAAAAAAVSAGAGVAKPVEERCLRILSATEPGEEGEIGVMAAETVTVGNGPGTAVVVVAVEAADTVLRRFRIVSAIAPGVARLDEEGVFWLDSRLAEAGVLTGAGGGAMGTGGADGGPTAAVADMSPDQWTMHLAVFAGLGSRHHKKRKMAH